MILYHLDRENSLPNEENKQLIIPIETLNTTDANLRFNEKYTNGISKHGNKYLNTFDEDYDKMETTYKNCRTYTIEYIFEMVRSMYYSKLPSRFTSLFACKTKDEVIHWHNILVHDGNTYPNITVKKISTNRRTLSCDACWRDQSLFLSSDKRLVFSPFAYHEFAKKYWQGITTQEPSMEILCELPVTVIESIPYSDFINH